MAKSDKLHKAKEKKNDEFYTQLSDIEKECGHYWPHFKGKTIFCNCDDPFTSNFFKYFALLFNDLGLKRLIAASYDPSPIAGTQLPFDEIAGMKGSDKKAYIFDATELPDLNKDGAVDLEDTKTLMKTVKEVVRPLQGNGDFRNAECIELLKQADIVVTNPPFSLFREYAAQLVEYGKKFLIIGNVNAVSYKEIFPLIKENKLWLGRSIHSGDREFRVPDYYPLNAAGFRVDENGVKYIRVKGVRWFTNLDHKGRHENIDIWKKYTPEEYPHYDNYDAIEVGKVCDIPADWDGVMGVPITFLDKYNPDQFEVIGMSASAGYNKDIVGLEKNENYKDARPLINGKNTYARVFIRRKV
jgi:hypothetical protein